MARESTIKPRRIGAQELRLGRAEGLGELAQLFKQQTSQRARMATQGVLTSVVGAATSGAPGFMQASLYNALTSNPFRSMASGRAGSTEQLQRSSGTATPIWAKNLERLYRDPLPITVVKNKLQALEMQREAKDITPIVVEDDEEKSEDKQKGFFGKLLDGFKNLFNFKGGLGNFLTKLAGGAGLLAAGGLKFAKGIGLAGLLATVLFNKEIITQLTKDFSKEAKDLKISEIGLRLSYFLTQGTEGGLKEAFAGAGKFGAAGAAAGAMMGGGIFSIPGAIIGGLLGSAIGGILGFIGRDQMIDMTKFAETFWKKSWNDARLGWETNELNKLKSSEEADKILLKQAIEEGDWLEASKIKTRLAGTRQEIHEKEKLISDIKIEIAEKELKEIKDRAMTLQNRKNALNIESGHTKKMDQKFDTIKDEIKFLVDGDEELMKRIFALDPKDSDGFAKIIDELEEKLDSGSLSKLIDSPSFLGRWGLPLDSDYANLEGRTKAETLIERLEKLPLWYMMRAKSEDLTRQKYFTEMGLALGSPEFQLQAEQMTGMKYGLGEDRLNAYTLDQWMREDPKNKSALEGLLSEQIKNEKTANSARLEELSRIVSEASGKPTVIVNDTKNVNASQGPRIDRSQTFFIGGPQVQYGPLNERGNF